MEAPALNPALTNAVPPQADPVAGQPHAAVWPAGVPHTLDVPNESLWQGLARMAHQAPQELGLHFLGRQWRWSELAQQAERLAAALAALGLQPGDRVLLFMQNCPQFVLSFFAAMRLGAVVVPVNPMNKADELGHYISDAQARIALASADIAHELTEANAGLAPAQRLRQLLVFDLAEALPQALASPEAARDAGWPAAWCDWLTRRARRPQAPLCELHEWSELMAQPWETLRPLPPPPANGDDLALLPYTSGTTGQPKACLHSHRSLLHNALSIGPWLGLRRGDAQLVVVPMFHITGLVMGLLGAVQQGAQVVLLPRWDRDMAARAIASQRVTHWPNIPTMVIDLLAAPGLADYDLRSLRYIGGGGAPMPEPVANRLQELFGLDYLEGYGLTETAAPTHTNPPGQVRRRCLGIPYIGTRARIVDQESFQPLPDGEVGEIWVSGPQLFGGYWRQAQATAQAFVEADGVRWFRTGDLGRRDAQGYYHLADRLKRMINASGFKVWPAEVEGLLHHHPGVQEVCIIAQRDPYRGESVKAVVVPKESHRATLSEASLIAWSREHMAAYKVPRAVEFADSLPRSASGKLMWRRLQVEQDQKDAASAVGTQANCAATNLSNAASKDA